MHSLSGIRHKYPYIEEYLPFLYGQTFENKNQDSFQHFVHPIISVQQHIETPTKTISHKERMRKDTRLAAVNMTEFYYGTMPK